MKLNSFRANPITKTTIDFKMGVIREIIDLATPTNGDDAEKKSYVDVVKQAATLVFASVYFFNYEMAHDDEKETKFLKSRSIYGVSNDVHFTVYSDKLTFDMDGTYEFH